MAAAEEGRLGLAIVGHVDHGKSTLVGRLLLDTGSVSQDRLEALRARTSGRDGITPAFVMDSLEEERSREITIDVSYAFLRTPRREYAIIDNPGHKRFLKNMLTGATRADAAILVVDASEGICEQTRHHINILHMLGVDQIIVAVNKMDLVELSQSHFTALSEELSEFLSVCDVKAIVPVVALDGDNIARHSKRLSWYSGPTILEALADLRVKGQQAELPLRMPVQDVCEVGGARLCIGRIESGCLAVGERVRFEPSGHSSIIRSLRTDGLGNCELVQAGQSVGITMTDYVPVDRGQVICHEHDPIASASLLKGSTFWLASDPLLVGERLRIRCATQEASCMVTGSERCADMTTERPDVQGHVLGEAEFGNILLRVKRPIAVDRFRDVPALGRFVLLRNERVVAVGIVTSHQN